MDGALIVTPIYWGDLWGDLRREQLKASGQMPDLFCLFNMLSCGSGCWEIKCYIVGQPNVPFRGELYKESIHIIANCVARALASFLVGSGEIESSPMKWLRSPAPAEGRIQAVGTHMPWPRLEESSQIRWVL